MREDAFDWPPANTIESIADLESLPEDVCAVKISPDLSDDVLGHLAQHSHVTTLDLIDLSDSERITAAGIELLIGTNIRHLRLLGRSYLGRPAYEAVCKLTELITLDLSCCDEIIDETKDGIKGIESLVNLEVLILDAVYFVSDRSLGIISRLPSLKHLSIDMCDEISNVGISELVKNSAIESLRLPHFPKITKEGYRMVCQIKTLRHLSIGGEGVDRDLETEFRRTIEKVTIR